MMHFIGSVSVNYFVDSRALSLVSVSISKEVYTDISLPEQMLCLKGNISIGVSELEECFVLILLMFIRMRCGAIPKDRFADGEVLFWSKYFLGKPTHSFRTSRGPFGICDVIQGDLLLQKA
ncbi:hypothetical protein CQW23_15308 [Capsicum baccatum]|uniref:Uncharacterized protein n=1 Tax=Capsicum baccatum TaxID=33114 RepID=A0A2G2WLW5_CAPBA|nr:hypothetical protein CQW23_15308 [Capsicum baccatum]